MDVKRKDRLVYTLFCAILLMYAVLFFFFFRSGSAAVTLHNDVIPDNVTSVTVQSSMTDVVIKPTDAVQPYVSYSRRAFKNSKDEVSLSQSGSEYVITVDRQSGNSISGLWRDFEPVTLYIPAGSPIKCSICTTVGSVLVENAQLQYLSVHSTAASVRLKSTRLDKLTFVSRLGSLWSDESSVVSMNAKVNLADFKLSGVPNEQGFSLDAAVSLGYVKSDEAFALDHPNIAVKYKDKLTCGGAESKITLNSNVALVRLLK